MTSLLILSIGIFVCNILLYIITYKIGYSQCKIAVIEEVIKPSLDELKDMNVKGIKDFDYREARFEQFEAMTDKFYNMK